MLPVFRYASHQTSDYTYYPVLSYIDRDDAGRSAESRESHAKDNPDDSRKLKIITLCVNKFFNCNLINWMEIF